MKKPGVPLWREREGRKLKYRLRNEVVQLLYFFKHSLVNDLMCFFSYHFIDKTVKGHHSDEILFIVDPILLPVRFEFFVYESAGSSNPLLIRALYLHRVFAVGYPDFNRKFLHPKILQVAIYLSELCICLSLLCIRLLFSSTPKHFRLPGVNYPQF